MAHLQKVAYECFRHPRMCCRVLQCAALCCRVGQCVATQFADCGRRVKANHVSSPPCNYIHTSIYSYLLIFVYTYILIHICIHIYTYIYIYIHINHAVMIFVLHACIIIMRAPSYTLSHGISPRIIFPKMVSPDGSLGGAPPVSCDCV